MSTEDQKEPSNLLSRDPRWEQDLLNRLAFAAINEQRRTRRWSIFFKSLGFLYLFLIFFMLTADKISAGGEHLGRHTALVEMRGEIADGSETSAMNVIPALQAAFEDSNTAGIILQMNSPGGSPVQSGYIYDEIRRLRQKHKKIPIYAVIGDICASGCYYIAAATDAIYANKASLVGSIGVLMDGFGFVGTMEKFGIERRLHTAGTSKGFLDPFSPEKSNDVAHLQQLLSEIHGQFIKAVKDGRGKRLKEDPTLFTGLVWTGEQAVNKGLADGLASTDHVARDIIKAEEIVDYTRQRTFFERVFERFGTAAGRAAAERVTYSIR
jgi:protease-4